MLTFIKDGTIHVTCHNLEMPGAVGAVQNSAAFSNSSGKFGFNTQKPDTSAHPPSLAGLTFQGFEDSSAPAQPSNVAKRWVFMAVLSFSGEPCNTPQAVGLSLYVYIPANS